eukprot:jgi/Ulvmu1/10385/UM061_0069.1
MAMTVASPAVAGRRVLRPARRMIAAQAAEAGTGDMGFKTMRSGVKVAADESLLTPRFYTTDFDEMEELFSRELNPNLDMDEIDAVVNEFRQDYNKTHFVRNADFKDAADGIQGATRKIFVEFLERSCTAEFSGFLLYKELGRRLKKINPAVAEGFTLMSRDEARHAGFLNKALTDFNLALDLGFLTKNRKYTFFKPKFIFYATYLSERIGYWRYISIYRHLQRNPDNQLYPLFEYFENWCQDENRHGDFFQAIMKARPEYLQDWKAKLWSRFFCHSVYITMYLNDHQRSAFYESLGLNTTQFNQHVIVETNNATARLFPAVPDCEHPEYFVKMDRLVELNNKLVAIQTSDAPEFIKKLQSAPIVERMVAGVFQLFCMKPLEQGSIDINEPAAVY